jgi:glutaredoxin-like protein
MPQESDLFNIKPSIIMMYSTEWCGDCKRAKSFFDEYQVQYEDINIEEDPNGAAFVRTLNNGQRIIPTIIFPDGEIFVEPSNAQLAAKLGLQTKDNQT